MNLERLFNLGPDHAVSAQDVFTDRFSEVEACATALRRVRKERQTLPRGVDDLSQPRRNVLVFYGMGGIGKTTLSSELQRRFDKGLLGGTEHRVSLRIDFGELSALDLEATLLRIRGSLAALGGKWPTFDLAMAAYWERKHPGEPLREFIERHPILGKISATIGIPDQIQSALDSLAGGMGAVGIAWRTGKLVKNEIVRRVTEGKLLKECPYFEPLLLEPSPDRALPFLPVLLAWDLASHQRKQDTDVVVFFDTWEMVQASLDAPEGIEDILTRLIYLMPNVLFVITGRSQVTWADEIRRVSLKYAGPKRWPDLALQARDPGQHLLGALSSTDCDRYLSERLVLDGGPAIPESVRRRIVKGSQGLPLYLDLSAERYDELLAQGEPDEVEFGGPLPELVTRVIRDLSTSERDLLRASSLVVAFDRDLLASAVPDCRDSTIQRFLLRHFVRSGRQGWLRHSLHDVIRSSVRTYDNVTDDRWSSEEWRKAAVRILEFLGSAIVAETTAGEHRNRDQLLECFQQGFLLAAEFDLAPEWLLESASQLRRLGQWQVLNNLSALEMPAQAPAKPLVLGSLALVQRACGTLEEAGRLLREGLAHERLPDSAKPRLTMELAEVLVRQNKDDEAERLLSDLAAADTRFSDNAGEWLAILDLRRGRFKSALRWTQKQRTDPHAKARALDLAAWVYFGNAFFDQSEQCLRTGLELARGEALAGLETGICEHLAWVVAWRRPHDGLVLAEEALNLSQQLESPIEIGRSLAARALAGIGTRPRDEVLADLQASIDHIERTGFRSDALGPLAIEVFLGCIEGDLEAARTARRRIARITEELHVDPGADALAAWWIESTSGEPELGEDLNIDWLDEVDAIRNRWTGVLTDRLTLMR